MNIKALLIILTLTLFASPSFAATSTGIKLLPPEQSNIDNKNCQEGEGNKILTWDGADTIKCRQNDVITDAGRLGIGTTTPQAKLDINGSLIISRSVLSSALNCWVPAGVEGTLKTEGGPNKDDPAFLKLCKNNEWIDLSIPDFTCPLGEYVTSAFNGKLSCSVGAKRYAVHRDVISANCVDTAVPNPNPWQFANNDNRFAHMILRWINTCGARYCRHVPEENFITGKVSEYTSTTAQVDCW